MQTMAELCTDLPSWANATEEEFLPLMESDFPCILGMDLADLNNVQFSDPSVHVVFEDIKPEYEKVQRKSNKRQAELIGGKNRQMIEEGHVHFFVSGSSLVTQWKIRAYVRRTMSAARSMRKTDRNYSDMAEMEVVTLRNDFTLNKLYCQVDLSEVYLTATNTPVFELSTTRTFQCNQFEIVVAVLLPKDGGERVFTSSPFLVKSKKRTRKRQAENETLSPTSSPSSGADTRTSSPAEASALASVRIETLAVEKAFIRELECVKFVTGQHGDIGYHFALNSSANCADWREGTVVAFLSTASGETCIEKLSAENIGQAKLAGVITRSAYVQSSMLLNKMDPSAASDIVCVMGTVKVSMLGDVTNGEAVFASPEIPGTAVSKSNLPEAEAWDQEGYIMLGQALETKDAPGPNMVHDVQCLVSLFLGIQSREIMQVVKEQRNKVRGAIKLTINREKRKITRNTVFGVISAVIFVVLLGVMLREFVSRSTAFQYYLCWRGRLDQAPACLKFRSPLGYNRTRKIKGYEFQWDVLQNKLGLETRPLEEVIGEKAGMRFRYFLNIDRCAYTRVWFRNRADNKVLVLHGIEVFAMAEDKDNVPMYHLDDDDDWEPLKSVVKVKRPC